MGAVTAGKVAAAAASAADASSQLFHRVLRDPRRTKTRGSLSRSRERVGVRVGRPTAALIPRLLPQAGEGAASARRRSSISSCRGFGDEIAARARAAVVAARPGLRRQRQADALHDRGPAYLSRTCNPVWEVGARAHLRSAIRGDLTVPRTRTRRFGPRSFRVSGPVVWNSLPEDIRTLELSLERFKSMLKTHLFRHAYA